MLVVESNPDLCRYLVEACLTRRIPARGVSRIADIERWPRGQVVVTDMAHLTPLWKEVGARAVIVLVDGAEEGNAALDRGATAWLPRKQPRLVHCILDVVTGLKFPKASSAPVDATDTM